MCESICINISLCKCFFTWDGISRLTLQLNRPLEHGTVQSLTALLVCRLGVPCGRTRGRPNGQTHCQHEKFCPSVEVGSRKTGLGDFEKRLQLEVCGCLGHFFMHKMQQPPRREDL